MMAFIWIALIYVIVAFTDITAGTFVRRDRRTRRAQCQFQSRRRGRGGEHYVSRAFDRSGFGRRISKSAALAFDHYFRSRDVRALWFGTKFRHLLSRHQDLGVLILPTASSPRWSRSGRFFSRADISADLSLHGDRGRRHRHLFRRLRRFSSRLSNPSTLAG